MKAKRITGRKALKNLLLTLGFHHSWGYYIYNENKNWRITIGKSMISCTKEGYIYDYINDYNYAYNTIDGVTSHIKKLFV